MEFLLRLTGRKAAFVYPIPPAPAVAILVPWFRPSSMVRVFPSGWGASAAAFAPAAIAGTWPQLEALLPEKIPSLTHALIVVSLPEDALLTQAQRRKLWDAFGVPVFQQIVTGKGLLLAAECEAHDGLHIESPKLPLEGREIDASPCGCGRKTPRLKPAGQPDPLRILTAYAR